MTKQKDFKLHVRMCVAGGYIGTYSLLRCVEGFGSAQTANMIHTVVSLLGGDFRQFLCRLAGILFYMAGIESYVLVSHKTSWDPKKFALLAELICVAVIGLLPTGPNQYLCLYAVFYMMAVQWSVFHGACGYTSATIFSTNNLKQFSLAVGNYLCTGEQEQARKAKFFGLTLCYYHIGAALVFLCWQFAGSKSVWACLLLLLFAAGLIYSPETEK